MRWQQNRPPAKRLKFGRLSRFGESTDIPSKLGEGSRAQRTRLRAERTVLPQSHAAARAGKLGCAHLPFSDPSLAASPHPRCRALDKRLGRRHEAAHLREATRWFGYNTIVTLVGKMLHVIQKLVKHAEGHLQLRL